MMHYFLFFIFQGGSEINLQIINSRKKNDEWQKWQLSCNKHFFFVKFYLEIKFVSFLFTLVIQTFFFFYSNFGIQKH